MHHAARRHLRNRQLGMEGKLIILPNDAEVGGLSLKAVYTTLGPCLKIKGLSTGIKGRKEVAESVWKGSMQTLLLLIFSALGRGSYHSTAVRLRSPWQFRYSLEAVLYHSRGAQIIF